MDKKVTCSLDFAGYSLVDNSGVLEYMRGVESRRRIVIGIMIELRKSTVEYSSNPIFEIWWF